MSRRREITVGAFVLGSALLAAWMAVRVGATGLGDQVEVTVRLDDVTGLAEGAPVLVAGVPVGRVTDLELDFDRAVAHLALDPAAGLRRDALARVRSRSLLGEKYVELVPASRDAPLLADGDRIERTAPAVSVDRVIAVADRLLAEVDPARLGAALDALLAAIEQDPERPARLLARVEALLGGADELSGRLDALAGRGEATLDELGEAVRGARDLARRLDALLDDLEPALRAAADDVDPAIREARAALADAREALRPLLDDPERLDRVLSNLEEIDRWELRRLLREEGILIRVRPHEVTPPAGAEDP